MMAEKTPPNPLPSLIIRLSISLACGLIIFVLLNLSAWLTLRGEDRVCPRQGETRIALRISLNALTEYYEEHGHYPDEMEVFLEGKRTPYSKTLLNDQWGNPFVYNFEDEEITISSFGRDGKPGGIGLDADLYHDQRNKQLSLPTSEQFFTADNAEVIRPDLTFGSFLSAGLIAIAMFSSFKEFSPNEISAFLPKMLIYAGILVVMATVIGSLLMPLHVPSGH